MNQEGKRQKHECIEYTREIRLEKYIGFMLWTFLKVREMSLLKFRNHWGATEDDQAEESLNQR